MWISLLIALITYLLSPRDTSKERKQALVRAAVVGGVTYGVTEYTDWGKGVSDGFDEMIGVTKPADSTLSANAVTQGTAAVAGSASANGSTGVLDVLKGWGASGTAAVIGTAGAVGAVASGKINWYVIGGAGLLAYVLLKD